MTFETRLSEWSPFASAQVSAAATLMGLVFVAVSINLRRILAVAGLTARAMESLLQFFQVFLFATLLLVPRLSVRTFGVLCVVLGLTSWGSQTAGLLRFRRLRAAIGTGVFARRTLIVQVATVPFPVAGMLLLLARAGAMWWLLAGFLFSFAGGLVGAWVLLVEILR